MVPSARIGGPCGAITVAAGAVPLATSKPALPSPTAAASAVARGGPGRVNRRMETNVPDVYAAGDCVETWHRLLQRRYLPLGTTAHKQGRVAGANAVGVPAEFDGSLGTRW
jgi:NADPH-dependent 2,4-dienoyl-CoA reductase/sulfur reductase-like enzyme